MNRHHFKVGLVCFVVCFTTGVVFAAIPTSERDALVSLYAGTDGANWYDNSGWLGAAGTERTWYGITRDGSGATVTAINLAVT